MNKIQSNLVIVIFLVFITHLLFLYTPALAKDSIRFGLHQNKPLNFRDSDGQVKGLVIDVFTHIAVRENWEVAYIPCKWKDCLEKLENGDIDVLSAIGYTAGRSAKFDFNNTPLITNWGMVVVHPGVEIQSVLDLEGKTISVMRKAGHTLALMEMLEQFRINADFLEVDGFMDVFRQVRDQRADAGVVNRLLASQFAAAYKVRKSSIIFNPIEIRYAFTKGRHTRKLDTVDRALLKMREDPGSIYYSALSHWFGDRKTRLPAWLKWIIPGSLGLIFLFVAISFLLRHQVKMKTAALYKKNRALEAESRDRRTAEARFRESEERYALAQESANIGTWDWDIPGGTLKWSEQIKAMFGFGPGEFKATYDEFIRCIHPEDRQHVTEAVDDALYGGKEYNIEHRIIRPGNGVRWVAQKGKVFLNQDNDPVRMLGVVLDITEQKEQFDRFQQAQKMEAIGTLAGGIAHDFNNILMGIFGYSQLAKAAVAAGSPEKAAEKMDQVLKGAQRAADLVQQILTFSRQTTYQRFPFQIHLEIKEALKLLRATIPTSIEIKTDLNSSSHVYADPIKIHQIIMNLCTNAYHAMKETGGILTVALSDTHVSSPRDVGHKSVLPGDYLLLEVGDTGTGMSERTLEKAFEPYFTTKGPGEGTGLGLALVKAIVDEHHGFMDVTSRPGQGTCFHLYFPVVDKPARDKTSRDTTALDFKGRETIMLVDDEEQIRQLYAEFLRPYGYTVLTFSDGAGALEGFREQAPAVDLVLTDLTMPGLTGEKLAAEILKIKPGLPVILLSGYSDAVTEEGAGGLGIDRLLEKPISPYDLIKVIRELLDKKASG